MALRASSLFSADQMVDGSMKNRAMVQSIRLAVQKAGVWAETSITGLFQSPKKNAGRAWDTAGIARKWEGERRVRRLPAIHTNHMKGCVLPDQIDLRFD